MTTSEPSALSVAVNRVESTRNSLRARLMSENGAWTIDAFEKAVRDEMRAVLVPHETEDARAQLLDVAISNVHAEMVVLNAIEEFEAAIRAEEEAREGGVRDAVQRVLAAMRFDYEDGSPHLSYTTDKEDAARALESLRLALGVAGEGKTDG